MHEDNFEWYKEHLPVLYAQYGDCYLAIKDKRVIGAYDSFAEAVNETRKVHAAGTFDVQRCGPDERAYTSYVYSADLLAAC